MKSRLHKWIYTTIAAALVLGACSDSADNETIDPEEVTIALKEPVASDITETGMSLYSQLAVNGNPTYQEVGFCYGTATNPTIEDQTVKGTVTGNSLTASLQGLTANTTYYIRGYVSLNQGKVVYSPQAMVMTATKPSGNEEPEELKNYTAPDYPDDYVSLADWSKRSQWNLANVHDPSVVLAEDGYYYMYQTDASYGNAHTAGGHFHGRRSKDLVNWEYLGGTMPSLPEWVVPKLNEIRKEMGLNEVSPSTADFGYWAPCVRKVKNGLYRMYYSIVCPGNIDGTGSWTERAFIGLMETGNPADNDSWEDKGYVITNASDKQLNFYVRPDDWGNCYFKWNAIDPSYLIDNDGKHYLIYGSWHSGIVALELNAETGKPLQALPAPYGTNEEIAAYGSLIATRQMGNRWQASEGPEIVYNAATGYYYLFVAYDALDVPYNTRVCRSRNIYGPYFGMDGTNLTETGGEMLPVVTHPYKFNGSHGWVGISHCAVFDDGKGNWYYASQGRFPANVDGNAYSNALMMGHVRSIRWTSQGWPVVLPERYGAVPQVAITEEELVGDWEHIDLAYSYGQQQTSGNMTLAADHTITAGTWKGGTWSYDADKQILTANGVELCLQRETDWEANPRTHTLVYAGYGGNNKTYWGKKKH